MTIVAGAAVAACFDAVAPPEAIPPPPDAGVADGQLHHLRWNARYPLTFLVSGDDEQWEVAASPAAGSGPPDLEQSAAVFWAVWGEERTVRIDYLPEGGASNPFLELSIPAFGLAERPDGSVVLPGDSVEITVIVDTLNLVVRFEPTGLLFDALHPARLQIWYAAADEDLNGDGKIDDEDLRIETEDLGVWYQELASNPWYAVAARQSKDTKWFVAELAHFSGYAVSY